MHLVGAHVSMAGGLHNAPANAKKIGATAFALFLKNPRGYAAPELRREEADAFRAAMTEHGYTPAQVVPHIGYLVNLGSPKPDIYEKSLASFLDELHRCELLGLTCLNIHPGSFSGGGDAESSMRRIAESINRGLDKSTGVTVVLENTAGQGSSVGHTFEQLAQMIDLVEDKSRVGICYDTCHGFVAGYDIRTKATYNATVKRLDEVVGLGYLRAMHLNDAKGPLGGHLDRHESLGKGTLGWPPFKLLMADARMEKVAMILETTDESLWPEEIEALLGFGGKKSGR